MHLKVLIENYSHIRRDLSQSKEIHLQITLFLLNLEEKENINCSALSSLKITAIFVFLSFISYCQFHL